MKQKKHVLPAFIEHGDVFYGTEEVMEKIETYIEAKGQWTIEDIAEETNLPVKVIKAGVKALQTVGALKILDPKKNPLEVLAALGAFPIANEDKSKKIH